MLNYHLMITRACFEVVNVLLLFNIVFLMFNLFGKLAENQTSLFTIVKYYINAIGSQFLVSPRTRRVENWSLPLSNL